MIGVIMDGFGGSYGYKLILGIEDLQGTGILHGASLYQWQQGGESRAVGRMLSLGAQGIIIMCVHGGILTRLC